MGCFCINPPMKVNNLPIHRYVLRMSHAWLDTSTSNSLTVDSPTRCDHLESFIHSILCRRTEGCTFYQRPCVDGTCPRCGGMEFLDKCIHVTDEHELGRHEVNLQSFKYVTYYISGGNERKKKAIGHLSG